MAYLHSKVIFMIQFHTCMHTTHVVDRTNLYVSYLSA